MNRRNEDKIDSRRWTVVCKHWLKGLCMKEDTCEYLHQMDLSRMPVCSAVTKGRACTAEDCVYKHVDPSQKRCEKYDHGFCINGHNCRERHERDVAPPDYIPDKIFAEFIRPVVRNYVPMRTDHLFREAWQVPFQGNTRYFLAVASTEVIEKSLLNNTWIASLANFSVLKEALRQCDNVVLVFIDNLNVYGFAKVVGKSEVNEETHMVRTRFTKKTQVSLEETNSFRNPYDGNILVRMGSDGQEIDPGVAEKLCSFLLQQEDRVARRGRPRENSEDNNIKKRSYF